MSKQTSFRTALRFGLMAALLALPSVAQEYRATITGTVVDPSGAATPNARIDVRNVDTAATASAQSNEAGLYTVPFLSPGTYDLTATVSGFKQSVRKGVEVHAGDKIQVDFKLEVGGTTETVTVTAESEQLRTATANMGQTINSSQMADLPLMGRNTYLAATFATGMYSGAAQSSSSARPYDGAASQLNAEGIYASYQMTINGIPNAPEERASAAIYTGFVPSPDAVEEVTVQTHTYDAQYGHSTGAVVNTVLKGGTNTLHGSVYEFFRNDKLNANSFNGNAAGNKRGVMRWNQPGFVVDGPVYLPKLYNGKDKTFFMFSMEMIRNASPLPYTGSYPTAAERTGDFTGLTTSSGQPVIIYDPATTDKTTPPYIRQPFPNNVIPANRIDPVGKAIINAYPLPNLAGTPGGFNNFVVSPNSQQDKYHSIASRVDHQINTSNRLTVSAFSNKRNQLFPTYGFAEKESSPGYLHYRNNHGASVDWTDTLSPTMVLNVKYGAIYHPFAVALYGDDYDITKLGFPKSFASIVPHMNYPSINMSNGYTGMIGGAGTGTPSNSQYTTTFNQSLSGTLTKIVGKHSLKTGAEMYIMKANNNSPASNINAFSFSAGFTQQNAQSGSSTAGNPWASLLLGWPSGGGVSNNIAAAYQQIYGGLFVQDDWRVTPRLTLTLGLRWEYESPMSERYDRQNAGFDFTSANPLQSQVTGLALKGGLLFTDANNRLPFKRDLNNWGPRIGASYRLGNNTVIRGGFGMNYSVTFQTGGSNGFSVTTGYIASTDNNITPANGLSNPFQTILQPSGRSLGLSTLVGQGFSFADPSRTIPKVYNYSLALQHQFPKDTLLEVAFAGNYATELSVNKGINALPRDYYMMPGGTLKVPNAQLTGQVANPMAGLIAGSSLNNATTAYQNLLLPYPEFGGITQSTMPIGKSLYNSMQVSVEKRLSAGLQGRVSFTWNKIMQETGFLQDQDNWLARAQSNEPTKVLAITSTYELPIFNKTSGLTHKLLGGWQIGGVMKWNNGSLVGAPNGSAYSTGVNPKLDNPTYQHWFNTCTLNTNGVRQNCASASEPVAFIQMQPYTLRTMSGVLPGVRTEMLPIVDLALFKSFQIHERTKLQFRANAFNVANTPIFGGPNTSFGSGNYGVIGISQSNDPRIVELALKLVF